MNILIPPEQLLLRASCRSQFSPAIREHIKSVIQKGIRWEVFIACAKEQGVLALLYKTLSGNSDLAGLLPASFHDESRNAYYLTLSRNMLFLKSLEDMDEILGREGIEVIIFKGLMLAESVYQDLGVRPMSDIDLLIKPADFIRVDTIFREKGFSAEFQARGGARATLNAHHNSCLYSGMAGGISVFLHTYWHLVNFLPYKKEIFHKIDMERIWHESGKAMAGNMSLRSFSLNHQIIYLSMHAMHHSFKPLISLCDINEILRVHQKRIDWPALTQEAFRFGLEKYLYYGLFFVSQIMGAEVPVEALEALKIKKISAIESRFISSVLRGKGTFTRSWLVYLGMNENLKGRVSYAYNVLFPTREELALIRQKDKKRVSPIDYIQRMVIALKQSFRTFTAS